MIGHAIQIARPIFQIAFPGSIAVFAFESASNHSLLLVRWELRS
jgi:hypothetical protein